MLSFPSRRIKAIPSPVWLKKKSFFTKTETVKFILEEFLRNNALFLSKNYLLSLENF